MKDSENPEFVAKCIRDAFPQLPFFPDASPSRRARRDEVPSFTGQNWWQADCSEVLSGHYYSSDFTTREAAYYCPLFLLCCLNEDGKWHHDYFEAFFVLRDENVPEGWKVFPEATRRHNARVVEFRELFSLDQKRAIARCLHHLANLNPDDDDLRDALNSYWGQFHSDSKEHGGD